MPAPSRSPSSRAPCGRSPRPRPPRYRAADPSGYPPLPRSRPRPAQPARARRPRHGARRRGFIGTTLPGSQPVQAQGAPPSMLFATTPPQTLPTTPSGADDASSASDAADTSDAAAASTATLAAAAAVPADASADAGTPATDDTSGGDDASSGDAGDGSDPLAGGTGRHDPRARGTRRRARRRAGAVGDRAGRIGRPPAGPRSARRSRTSPRSRTRRSPPASRSRRSAVDPATRAGCTAPSPVTPGTVDDHGVVAGTGCDYPAGASSIAGAIARDGRTWKAYVPAATPQDAGARLCHPTDGDPATQAFAQRSPLGHLADLTGSPVPATPPRRRSAR